MSSGAARQPVTVLGQVEDVFRSPEHRAAGGGGFDATVAVCFTSDDTTLPDTIASLQRQHGRLSFELLLVSNATRDRSVAVGVAAAAGLPVRVVRCDSAGYDANARNVSMVEAASEKILFLDADDVADDHFVGAMAAALDGAGVVTADWELRRLNEAAFPELAAAPAGVRVPMPFQQGGWPYAPAGTLGLRRAVAHTIGGFDHDLSYAANNEWCFRARAAGHPVEQAPGATVFYRLRPSPRSALRQHYRWGVWEVAAARRARGYGLPRPRPRQFLGRFYRLLRGAARLRTPYGRFRFAGDLGAALGHYAGSVRFRSLDL